MVLLSIRYPCWISRGCSNTSLPRQLVPPTSLSLRSANSLPLACRNSKFSSSYHSWTAEWIPWAKRCDQKTGWFEATGMIQHTEIVVLPNAKIWIWNKRMIPICFLVFEMTRKIVASIWADSFIMFEGEAAIYLGWRLPAYGFETETAHFGDYISYGAKLPLLHCRLGPCSLYFFVSSGHRLSTNLWLSNWQEFPLKIK